MAGGAENAGEGAVSRAGPDGAPCCWKSFRSHVISSIGGLCLSFLQTLTVKKVKQLSVSHVFHRNLSPLLGYYTMSSFPTKYK